MHGRPCIASRPQRLPSLACLLLQRLAGGCQHRALRFLLQLVVQARVWAPALVLRVQERAKKYVAKCKAENKGASAPEQGYGGNDSLAGNFGIDMDVGASQDQQGVQALV